MKTLIVASALAAASLFSASIPVQAASVTITTTDTRPAPRYVQERRHHRHHDCYVKKVKTHRHGKVIIKETRVCR
jgi:hypothetical protein